MVSMKFCSHCGAALDDGSIFCGVCGKPSNQEAVGDEPAPSSEVSNGADSFVFPEGISESVSSGLHEELAAKNSKKRRRRKIILISAAALLVAAAVICIIIFTSPKYKIMRAFENTMDDLSEACTNCDNYTELAEVVSDLSESGQFSSDIGINMGVVMRIYYSYRDYDEVEEAVSSDVHIDRDSVSKILDGNMDITVSVDDKEIPFNILFSANEEHTMFTAPDLADKTFFINNQTFGEDFIDSYIYDTMEITGLDEDMLRNIVIDPFPDSADAEEKAEAVNDAFKDFMKKVDIESGDSFIPGFEGDVYHLSFTGVELEKLITDIIAVSSNGSTAILESEAVQDMLEEIREAEYNVNLGIADRKLTAMSFQIGNSHAASLVLTGEDNIWSSFNMYSDDKETLTGGINATPEGLELRFEPTDEDGAVIVSVNDALGKAGIIYKEDGEEYEVAAFTYSVSDGAASMSFEINRDFLDDFTDGTLANLCIDYTISPLTDEPAMLSDKATSFFGLKERDFVKLIYEIVENLAYDPDFAWVFAS